MDLIFSHAMCGIFNYGMFFICRRSSINLIFMAHLKKPTERIYDIFPSINKLKYFDLINTFYSLAKLNFFPCKKLSTVCARVVCAKRAEPFFMPLNPVEHLYLIRTFHWHWFRWHWWMKFWCLTWFLSFWFCIFHIFIDILLQWKSTAPLSLLSGCLVSCCARLTN